MFIGFRFLISGEPGTLILALVFVAVGEGDFSDKSAPPCELSFKEFLICCYYYVYIAIFLERTPIEPSTMPKYFTE